MFPGGLSQHNSFLARNLLAFLPWPKWTSGVGPGRRLFKNQETTVAQNTVGLRDQLDKLRDHLVRVQSEVGMLKGTA